MDPTNSNLRLPKLQFGCKQIIQCCGLLHDAKKCTVSMGIPLCT